MRVLIVGSGGREHALAWKLAAEPEIAEIVVAPGSGAIDAEPRVRAMPGVEPLDAVAVVQAARACDPDLVVIGPEAPLARGVVDALEAAGIATFGPTRAAARLESSKAFCHEVAAAAGVPMARARSFRGGEVGSALAFVRALAADGAGVVLKADGLAAGKGVIVTNSETQALDLAPGFLTGHSPDAPALVVEERLAGPEASVIAICDGERAIALPAARDHKRLCDGDAGPNTGGMGAYSPLPDLDDEDVDEILAAVHRPILTEMAHRGTPFRGFLYAGLMLTRGGPILLECNARLGDPEAQVILPRVAVSVGPLLLAAAGGGLPMNPPDRLPALPGATVGIVLAAAGYPGDPRRGDPIAGLHAARDGGALVFHAGTVARPGGGYGTNGGRVLTVVGRGGTPAEARAAAERGADAISWHGLQRRHDVGLDLPEPALAGSGPSLGGAR